MAIYTAWTEIRQNTNRPIWACAYEFCNNKQSMRLNQEPIRGMICGTIFYPLKKNSDTDIVRSRGVYFDSRKYADTYEECVILYNGLIQKEVEWLEERIREAKEDFIEVKIK